MQLFVLLLILLEGKGFSADLLFRRKSASRAAVSVTLCVQNFRRGFAFVMKHYEENIIKGLLEASFSVVSFSVFAKTHNFEKLLNIFF